MTTATLDTEDGSFFVTDAMYVEVQELTKGTKHASHAVIYPHPAASDGWSFEIAGTAKGAEWIASKIGPDAVVLDL